ncbi:putative S-layer protein [Candidatus Pacearchaeota archaeon]|nr:putative S-layer protein [Candidatus Pacearchaeota archaeon]
MANKTFILSLASLFAITFFVSFASAAILNSTIISVPSSVAHNAGSFSVSFNMTNTGVDASPINWSSSLTSGTATITLPTDTSLIENQIKIFTATLSFPSFQSNNIAFTITADPSGVGLNETISFSVPITLSPSLSISSIQTLTKTQNATINITNTGNQNLGTISLSASGDFNVSFYPTTLSSLAPGASALVNVTSTSNLTDKNVLSLGPHPLTITASATGATNTLVYTINGDFCDYGNVNASLVSISNIKDKYSETEWEWKPLDNVTVTFDIENNIGDDKDFTAELALYDSVRKKFVDLEDENSLSTDLSINDGNNEKVSFTFKVPADLEDSDGKYVLYVKAYVDGKEKSYCNSYPAKEVPDGSGEDIRIDKKENDVKLDEISYPTTAKPGEIVTISASVFNIGTEDQDKVKVMLTNSKLNLNLESYSFSLDSGDSTMVDFSFVVPASAENGIYALRLTPYLDYKSSTDTYAKQGSSFDAQITISGGANATTTTSLSGITASLESEAKAGSNLEITATITNFGTSAATFVVGAVDYDSWAILNSVSDRIITLAAGESKDVKISLSVNEGVSGEQTFKIESRSGDKIDSKVVAVEIGAKSLLSSLADSLTNNTMLWIIGAVNVILIIFIIVLAIRFLRR